MSTLPHQAMSSDGHNDSRLGSMTRAISITHAWYNLPVRARARALNKVQKLHSTTFFLFGRNKIFIVEISQPSPPKWR